MPRACIVKPDWGALGFKPHRTKYPLWELVILSFGFEPSTVPKGASGVALKIQTKGARGAALTLKGMAIFLDKRFNPTIVQQRMDHAMRVFGDSVQLVCLKDFVSWAIEVNWEIPSELAGMGALRDASNASMVTQPMRGESTTRIKLPTPDNDQKLLDMRKAYVEVRKSTQKEPSKRAVADRSGYSRQAVSSRWQSIISVIKQL